MADANNNHEVAIKLSGVKKRYKLGQIGGGTLQADLQSWWARVRGKEDPNTKIGQEQRLVGQSFMALNGIDLTIYKGEALGIIGGNGAGKSTMLKLLSRVTAPTEGEIDIYGRIASMLEVGTGFNGEMTGRENVYMNGAILGMTKAEIDAKMEQIIEFSEVRDFIDTPVKRYSSGMYVKLAFSVAAHLDSEIMIMDEVLAVGDMAFQKKCLDRMRTAAKEEGRTVLYVSHNMNTIRQLCDRCVVLDKGKVIFEGGVEEAISVYMKQNFDRQTLFELFETKRTIRCLQQLRFSSLEITGMSGSEVSRGNDLNFTIKANCDKDIEDVFLRFEVFFSDGSIAGTAFSSSAVSAKAGNVALIDAKLATDNFAPGVYSVAALFFQKDSFGGQVVVDRVDPAMVFKVLPQENDVLWLHQHWGHVMLNNIEISSVKFA